MPEVLVGMSGGVDSSVAALLLKRQGYNVTGCTLTLFDKENIIDSSLRTCCSLADVDDARSVCNKLGIEHFVFNFKDLFRDKVIDNFVSSYLSGSTPNPCIECNRWIKFDKMLRRAEELGIEYIATGHYAHIKQDENGRYLLIRPKDRSKDQTYVLYNLTQHQLAHTLFPLAELDKSETRRIAEEAGLINSRKPDSQDICFVPDGDYASFIEKTTGKISYNGNFTDVSGNIIGTHRGMIHYTTGQRKGLGVSFGKPMFVVDKNAEENTVTLGEEKDLYTNELMADDINFISVEKLERPMKVTAKARYSQHETSAVIEECGSFVKVTFDAPQRAVTRGQAVVFYDGDIVVGGGRIV